MPSAVSNPWLHVPLNDYERHMSLPAVGRAQMIAQQLGHVDGLERLCADVRCCLSTSECCPTQPSSSCLQERDFVCRAFGLVASVLAKQVTHLAEK